MFRCCNLGDLDDAVESARLLGVIFAKVELGSGSLDSEKVFFELIEICPLQVMHTSITIVLDPSGTDDYYQ